MNPFAEIVVLGSVAEETKAFMLAQTSDPDSNVSGNQFSRILQMY
jgi:hypothetical protein